MVSQHEATGLQVIHDTTIEHGRAVLGGESQMAF